MANLAQETNVTMGEQRGLEAINNSDIVSPNYRGLWTGIKVGSLAALTFLAIYLARMWKEGRDVGNMKAAEWQDKVAKYGEIFPIVFAIAFLYADKKVHCTRGPPGQYETGAYAVGT